MSLWETKDCALKGSERTETTKTYEASSIAKTVSHVNAQVEMVTLLHAGNGSEPGDLVACITARFRASLTHCRAPREAPRNAPTMGARIKELPKVSGAPTNPRESIPNFIITSLLTIRCPMMSTWSI